MSEARQQIVIWYGATIGVVALLFALPRDLVSSETRTAFALGLPMVLVLVARATNQRRGVALALGTLIGAAALTRHVGPLALLGASWVVSAGIAFVAAVRIVVRPGADVQLVRPAVRTTFGVAIAIATIGVAIEGGLILALQTLPAVTRVTKSVALERGENEVTVTSRDGVTIRGALREVPGARGGAILLHGVADGRMQMREWGNALARVGVSTLRLDHRAHGRSGGAVSTLIGLEVDDARRAMERLARTDPARPIVIVGASMGGGVALELASRVPSVRGVVLIAPASDYPAILRHLLGPLAPIVPFYERAFRLPSLRSAVPRRSFRRTSIPGVVFHGTDDMEIPIGLSKRLVRESPGLELVELEGVDHRDAPREAFHRGWLRVVRLLSRVL